MKVRERGKRNIDKYMKSVIKVSGKSIQIKNDNFRYLNKLKGRLQIENDNQVICYDDVISYLRHIEQKTGDLVK